MEVKPMRKLIKNTILVLSLTAAILASFVFSPLAYADTNGSELKITAQPDRLVLDLGSDWAGAEFELKLDAGVFPVPVIVNETGILSMDLGGSKTYSLRLISIPASDEDIIQPDTAQDSSDGPPQDSYALPGEQPTEAEQRITKTPVGGIPTLHLVLFIGGSLAAIGGLVIMKALKKRRYSYYDDEYDYDQE